MLNLDRSFYEEVPFYPDAATPIHRWFLVRESSSLQEVAKLLTELRAGEYDLVIDPFCGAGTSGLQCAMLDRPFLGFDTLASCVIGTRAKLFAAANATAYSAALERLPAAFETHFRSLLRLRFHTESAYQTVAKMQSYLLANVSGPTIYMCLSALYSAVLEHSPTPPSTFGELLRSFSQNLRVIQSDLQRTQSWQRRHKQIVRWRDCTERGWGLDVRRAFCAVPAKVILVTSPPYFRTSQDRSALSTMCNQAGGVALAVLEHTNGPSTHQRRSVLPVRVRSAVSPSWTDYLSMISRVLRNFRTVAAPESTAVIQAENALDGAGTLVEVDLLICAIATELGMKPDRVRVTHFVGRRPGVRTEKSQQLRGSFVYIRR